MEMEQDPRDGPIVKPGAFDGMAANETATARIHGLDVETRTDPIGEALSDPYTRHVVMHTDRLDPDAGPIDWRMVGIGGGITAPVDVDEHVYRHLLSAIGTWAFCYAFGLVLGAIASIALRSVLG